ncbi:MAG: hypothetical protein M0Q96_03980 [Candidatus Omnitrophica bacterium]|nr:hypothetical protein [Candidatus Omnitrophota bacterium]
MKKHIILAMVFLLLTVLAVLFSTYQTKQLENNFPAPQAAPKNIVLQPKFVAAPVISRPEDYGMVVTKNSDPVLSQEYWDNLISSKISNLKASTPRESLDKLNHKIKEDPLKTQNKIKLINENIKNFSNLLAKDPNNEEAKKRLEHFLMLKTLAEKLPNNE